MKSTLARIKADTKYGFRYLAGIDIQSISGVTLTPNKYRAKKFSFSEKEVVISGIHRKKKDGYFPQIYYCW